MGLSHDPSASLLWSLNEVGFSQGALQVIATGLSGRFAARASCRVHRCSGFILPSTGSEDREVLGVGSIPVAIPPSCQYLKTVEL